VIGGSSVARRFVGGKAQFAFRLGEIDGPRSARSTYRRRSSRIHRRQAFRPPIGNWFVSDKHPIVDLARIDLGRVIADIGVIRRYNPQRHEMEQLSAIVHDDLETLSCVGYKDITHDEFWVRGHMPGMPLMPGVVMCEAAAQLASYYTQKHDLLGTKMVGFGGLEDVRFRAPVIPGDRLVIMVQLLKVRRGRMIECRFQGFVRDTLVVDGIIKGIPLPVDLHNSAPPAE
jgi:3-hydroxyacyl-[acyl-carrier-protein] dehydratase